MKYQTVKCSVRLPSNDGWYFVFAKEGNNDTYFWNTENETIQDYQEEFWINSFESWLEPTTDKSSDVQPDNQQTGVFTCQSKGYHEDNQEINPDNNYIINGIIYNGSTLIEIQNAYQPQKADVAENATTQSKKAIDVLLDVYGCKDLADLKKCFFDVDNSLAMTLEAMNQFAQQNKAPSKATEGAEECADLWLRENKLQSSTVFNFAELLGFAEYFASSQRPTVGKEEIERFIKEELTDSDKPYHFEAEGAATLREFAKWALSQPTEENGGEG